MFVDWHYELISLKANLWKVELDCLPPESPPSDWNPSSRGSMLPSRLLRPLNKPEANEGTERRLWRDARDATSEIARFLSGCSELRRSSSLW